MSEDETSYYAKEALFYTSLSQIKDIVEALPFDIVQYDLKDDGSHVALTIDKFQEPVHLSKKRDFLYSLKTDERGRRQQFSSLLNKIYKSKAFYKGWLDADDLENARKKKMDKYEMQVIGFVMKFGGKRGAVDMEIEEEEEETWYPFQMGLTLTAWSPRAEFLKYAVRKIFETLGVPLKLATDITKVSAKNPGSGGLTINDNALFTQYTGTTTEILSDFVEWGSETLQEKEMIFAGHSWYDVRHGQLAPRQKKKPLVLKYSSFDDSAFRRITGGLADQIGLDDRFFVDIKESSEPRGMDNALRMAFEPQVVEGIHVRQYSSYQSFATKKEEGKTTYHLYDKRKTDGAILCHEMNSRTITIWPNEKTWPWTVLQIFRDVEEVSLARIEMIA